ncbi:hypothetical protein BAnh1_09970 [Bartonella australis AUST/NH1]|uniref:Uncharacterized protein n=1 Tax=Bartonella australis (strain Aust/NH1) TaxID=1094489 RepID=M1NZL9_BARAA|nr:isocitrate/isopropylmalate family dehydrogenase [Bartonella australis]AGF74867.1 hypothetical protein BAnh1_09970 [Bartonella australis AUST/NH1]
MKKKILVLPGDGVGPEICGATLPILERIKVPVELIYGEIGWECWKKNGDPIPSDTWEKIKISDAILLGAITSKGEEEAQKELAPHLKDKRLNYVSPIIQLRQKLGLFANIRPFRYISGPFEPFRGCVICENTEGLHAGMDFRSVPEHIASWLKHPNIEKYGPEEAAWSVQLQTKCGLERLFKSAFSYAKTHALSRVTFANKSNIMRESGQFAEEIFEKVSVHFPDIEAEIHDVDVVALWLVKKPRRFGVIVAENMLGDILSNVAAGVMGGLGLAPSANIGEDIAYFEPVHESAACVAGQGKTNPAAMFYTISLLLEYLNFKDEARSLSDHVDQLIRSEKILTYDLGGVSSTKDFANNIIDTIEINQKTCISSVITIGDELLSGQYLNTNLQSLSKQLEEKNIRVRKQFVCADSLKQISETIIQCLDQDDLIIISGGLGPTSDDKTRDAVAIAVQRPLIHHEIVWETVQSQLKRLGIQANKANSRQALFPKNATVLDNLGGTAPGFHLRCGRSCIVVLPGPPTQANPLLARYLEHFQGHQLLPKHQYAWTLIGISESEIANWVDEHLADHLFESHFLWKSPYVIVQLVSLSAAPLSKIAKENFEKRFRKYLVGAEITTAQKKLAPIASIQFSSQDPNLLKYLQKEVDLNKGENKLQIEANININPSIEEVYQQTENLGRIKMDIKINRKKSYFIEFPYTLPLLKDVLIEYASWTILQHIHNEKSCKK